MVLSVLKYSCETWAQYHCHIQQVEQFYKNCFLSICGIKWQDRVANLHVLEKCGIHSIECLLIQSQLQWISHVVHMEDSRILKMLLYRQLKD